MIIQGNLQNGSFCLSINRLVMRANDFTAENDLESFQTVMLCWLKVPMTIQLTAGLENL